MMKNKLMKLVCAIVLNFWLGAMYAQTVTFYTPRTVRIEKPQNGQPGRESLVVIAQPENVKVKVTNQNGAKVYKSAYLTVTVKDGLVSFADNKGNAITTEGSTKDRKSVV